jgi:hypothetical protein
MKLKKFRRKLNLNKKTIADLNIKAKRFILLTACQEVVPWSVLT